MLTVTVILAAFRISAKDCITGFRSYFKGVVLAPSHVSRRLFECDKRLEWVNHSSVADKWVMTDPHEPLKFKINNPLSRIQYRKPTTRGAWCSQNSLEIGPESLYNNLCTPFKHDIRSASLCGVEFVVTKERREKRAQRESCLKGVWSLLYLTPCQIRIFHDSVTEPIFFRFTNRDRAKNYRPFPNFCF